MLVSSRPFRSGVHRVFDGVTAMRSGFLLTITACVLGFAGFAMLAERPAARDVRGDEDTETPRAVPRPTGVSQTAKSQQDPSDNRVAIEPNFVQETKLSLRAKGVTTAVVCYAPKDLKWDISDLDTDLAKYVFYRLASRKIKVVRPDPVRVWLDKNPEWDRPEEIGAAFKTKYVVHIELEDFKLYEKGNQNLYRGRADVDVQVVEMGPNGEGAVIYRKQLTSMYPLMAGRPTHEITYARFKRAYLARLSAEIAELFYVQYSDDVPDCP